MSTVSRETAASDLDVSYSTIVRWEKSGLVVPVRIGPKMIRIDTLSSPAYLQKSASSPAGDQGAGSGTGHPGNTTE